jgi:thiamine transport system ATP-binding protein
VAPGGPATGTVLASTPSVDGARVRLRIDGIGDVDAVAGPGHPLVVGETVAVRFDPAGMAELP